MARVKRGTTANKRRKNILEHTKGFRWGRKSKFRLAKQAILKAWSYAFRDRRAKKREFRRLWNTKIGAAAKEAGTSYSKLQYALKVKNIGLDRKILSQLAEKHPDAFRRVVEESSK